MKLLLQNGTVVNGQESGKKDILLDGEIICRVDTEISPEEADEVVDLEGKLVFPGFIDAHTHFDLEVSGTVTADDFESGTLAAIAGGTTTIVDFATQNKGETLREALANWHKKADEDLPVITDSTWPFLTGMRRYRPDKGYDRGGGNDL